MKKIENYNDVKAQSGDFERPPAGGYIIEVLDVEDVPLDPKTGKGDYLRIKYDIAHGDFAGYYQKQHERFGGDYYTSFVKSYKEKALGMFKHFTNCIEESNAPYTWDWNEKTLVGKFLGVTLQEEEYKKKDGSIGKKLTVKDIKTCQQIFDKDFKVPQLKALPESEKGEVIPQGFEAIDEDCPF